MKNALVMGAVGVGMACITVGGLLGVQGRLTYEGTKHIPLLNALFTRPAEVEPAVASAAVPRAAVPRSAGPRSGSRARVAAPPVAGEGPAAAGGGVPTVDAHPEVPAVRAFAPGALFDLKPIAASGLSVDEVNRIVESARAMQRATGQERDALLEQRRELELREADLAAREARVGEWLQQVDAERARLETEIAAFNRRVVELPVDELPGLRSAARTIAKLVPEAAAELLLELWQSDGGQERVVKLLAVMNEDRADEILACLDTRRIREILEQRMRLARTGPGDQGERR